MATAAVATPQREKVFCHECRKEWYRDEHGLVCPNESCRSDFVEIIENNNDPRMPDLMDFSGEEDYSDDEDEHTHGYPHPQHRLFSHIAEQTRSPGGTTIIRTEGPGFSYVTARTTYNTTRPPRTPGVADDEVIADLFSTMLRNIVGDQYAARNRHAANQEGHQEGNTGESGEDRSGQPHFHPFASGFGGERLNPRNADSSQAGEPPQVSDINTFLATLFGPPAGPDQLPILARLFGAPPGAGGDYVYSQAELDRIVSQLMEQHQGNAPPPAAKEDIEGLPKIKVTQAMVNDGIDCAVCKEDLVLDEQVTTLPCKHSYHFECVSKWLEAHDTCPICRHPITPEDRRQRPQPQPAPPSAATSTGIIGTAIPFLGLFGAAVPRPMSATNTQQPHNQQPPNQQTPSTNSGAGSGGESQSREGTGTSDTSNQGQNSSSGARGAFSNLFRRRAS